MGENNMRSDYALYAVAIVFFILTGVVVAYSIEQQLWIVTTTVLGLVFIGLGYTQRPRQITPTITTPTTTTQIITPPPPPPVQTTVKEEVKEEKTEQIAVEPSAVGLTQVKGIKEKRAEQLKVIGINSMDDLANASANDIAAKLQISPKITGKWIESAKELASKS
jgi:predicted flap endonuclease-1-like 5' DNA nuclease